MREKSKVVHKEDLSEYLKKKFGLFAGLKVWESTNMKRTKVLISRHWPHITPWSWAVYVAIYKHPFSFFSYRNNNGHIYFNWTLFFINFSYRRQPDDWMVKEEFVNAFLEGKL